MKAGRKNLKREALEDRVEEPGEGHVLMRVLGLRGGNIVEAENAAGESTLCLLPAKFQKTIWIKTGTIVVVDEADREKAVESGSKVTGTISRVLLENQVRALRKSVSWWPELFKDERLVYPDGETLNPKIKEVEDLEDGSESDDGLPPLEANSNRQHSMSTYECAESDDSSDDEEMLDEALRVSSLGCIILLEATSCIVPDVIEPLAAAGFIVKAGKNALDAGTDLIPDPPPSKDTTELCMARVNEIYGAHPEGLPSGGTFEDLSCSDFVREALHIV